MPHSAATDPLDELRAAVTTIRRATSGPRPLNRARLAAAHRTLTRCRPHTTGPIRDALDHYLDRNTWRNGPFMLLNAIADLNHRLGLPDPAAAPIAEQLTLF
jgi:hypothetical protein